MGKRYRYITNGSCTPNESVSSYRLIGGNNINHHLDAIRIEIPDDMELEKWSCDSYSTTEDTRLIKDLNPCVLVRVNMKMTYFDDLQKAWLANKVEPYEFGQYMEQHHSYRMWLKFGFITDLQSRFCSKFHKEVLMLDKLPNIKSQTEIDEYEFPYPFEQNKSRIEMLRKYFEEYPEFEDDVRKELLSYTDKELLCKIYKYADQCCTNRPDEIERHLKDDFEKKMMSYYWSNTAKETLDWKELRKKYALEGDEMDE